MILPNSMRIIDTRYYDLYYGNCSIISFNVVCAGVCNVVDEEDIEDDWVIFVGWEELFSTGE